MAYEALKVRWISGRANIGVVAVKTSLVTWHCYITTVVGNDVETDTQYVIDWGSSLSESEASGFFPYIPTDLEYKK